MTSSGTTVGGEPEVHYPFPEPPAPGRLREVAPGVHWLRMPLPFKLDHINLWLLADGEGWTMIDSGFASDDTRRLWSALWAGDAAGGRPTRLVVTHYHPDHFGLAGWHVREHHIPLFMTQAEWLTGEYLGRLPAADASAALGAHYRRHGVPQDWIDRLEARGNDYANRIGPLPSHYRRLSHGDTLEIGGRAWKVIVGEGHAPEHATLYCDTLGVLISGDQILPKITPNIPVTWFEPDADPLHRYLASLERFRPLPAETLVLPSHRLPFRGLHRRLDELAHHHDDRLTAVERAVADGPKTAYELLPHLFRMEMDDHHLFFAMGEAVAHCAHLAGRGRLARERADGVFRYRLAA